MTEEEKDKCPLCGHELTEETKKEKVRVENLKDLYNKYYEGKEYHLKRFWENSIFVWTFLMVCFTAYGLLMNKFLDNKLHDEVKQFFPIISSFVCFIGFSLSTLWYKMTKASKAWFEVYEIAIWELESLNNKFGYDRDYLVHNYWFTKNGERISSPSKIVIAIGALLILFWIIALIFGIYIGNAKPDGCCLTLITICVAIVMAAFIGFAIFDLKSSTLRNRKEQEIFKQVKNDEVIQKEDVYFEVKDGKLKFFVTNDKQENAIFNHYKELNLSKESDTIIVYNSQEIDKYYKNDNNPLKDSIIELFNEKTIRPNNVRLLDKTLYLGFEGSNYKSDNTQIAEVVEVLLKDYDNVKVNYSLTTNTK